MGVPLDPDKYGRPVVMSAVERLAYRRRMGTIRNLEPPEAVILCYQPQLLAYAAKKQRGQKIKGFFGDFYMLKKTGRRIGVAGNFGVGAPAAAVLLEDLAAFGVKRFISIGIAGGIQATGRSGDLVVAEQALRDEGTSYHYLPSAQKAVASTEVRQRLERALQENEMSYICGRSWTTDAPYRETMQEHARYQEEGVLTVEMEAAALYAVAKVISVEVCAAFCIGDTVRDGKWQLEYDTGRVNERLQQLFDVAVQAFLAT